MHNKLSAVLNITKSMKIYALISLSHDQCSTCFCCLNNALSNK